MKRIIMFVLLFAALKVAGQTTGYLRFDTVKIMKQNGTCELYLINKTKDSLGLLTNVGGGLTQFRKSKMLNDSTIVIGLDTLTIPRSSDTGFIRNQFTSAQDAKLWIDSTGRMRYLQVDSFATFAPIAAPTYAEGRFFYDNSNKTFTAMDDISGTSIQLAYENLVRARNNTGSTINDGQVVYVSGAIGQNPTIALAQANSVNMIDVIGLATHNISNNTIGKVTTFGLVNDINTSAFTDGASLYLSATTPGGLTTIIPSNPNFEVFIGYCLVAHPTQGKILVDPQKTIFNTFTINDSTLVVGRDTVIIRGRGLSGLTSGRITLSTSATTIGDDAELVYNSTTNTVVIGSISDDGVNKLQVGGNAKFNGAAMLGISSTLKEAPFTAGTISGVPHLALYNSAGAADGKIWQWQANPSTLDLIAWNDAVSAGTAILNINRSGNNITTIGFPNGNIIMGAGVPAVSLHLNTVDAIRIPTGTSAQRPTGAIGYFRYNSTDDIIEWYNGSTWIRPLISSPTTLYSGDGTLAGNRVVTGNNLSLTFDDIFAFKINSDYNTYAKANGTGIYSSAVIGAGNVYEIGYTPVAGIFSKGAGVFIDTNENVGIGAQPPTTIPLYATGASLFVQGLQSNAGNFNRVDNVTTTGNIGLTSYFITIDATAGNITLTLPAASTAFGNFMGIKYKFQRIDASGNTVTIQRAGSDTINGGTSFTITTQYTEIKEVQCTSASTWAQN